MLASVVFLESLVILLDTDGLITEGTVELSVCTTLLVSAPSTSVTVPDGEIDVLLNKCVDVDVGATSLLLFTDSPTNTVEDVIASVEPGIWLCILLTWVVMPTVCVNVTVGNPECSRVAVPMSSVIFGVVDVVDGTVL